MPNARKISPKIKQTWFTAIRAVLNKGLLPNQSNVTTARGKGSYADAKLFMTMFTRECPKEWDSAGNKLQPMPDEIQPVADMLWNAALKQATLTIETELIDDLAQKNSKLTEELEMSKETATELKGMLAQQQKQLSEHAVTIQALMLKVATLEAQQKIVATAV